VTCRGKKREYESCLELNRAREQALSHTHEITATATCAAVALSIAVIRGTGVSAAGTYLTRWSSPGTRRILGPMLPSISETIYPAVPPLPTRASRKAQGSQTFLPLLLIAVALGIAIRYLTPLQWRAAFAAVDVAHPQGATSLFAAVAAAVVLHEAGHLLAALLFDFQILGIALGPFRAARSFGTWRVRFSARTFFSGSVSAIPRNTRAWRGRMLLVVAAGPIATLLTGTAAAAVFSSHPNSEWSSTFLAALTQLSLFIFVLGLIPNSRDARIRNDARLLLILRRDSQEARSILLCHLVTQLEVAGTRPQDYPEQLMLELAATPGRAEFMLFSAHTIFLWALDRGRLGTADAWQRHCLELSEDCQPRSRNLALASSACFDVLFRNRPMEALNKFADVDWQTLSPSWLMHRARAAHYLALENVPECLDEISRARYDFEEGLPICAFERMLLSRLHRNALNLQPLDLSSRVHQIAA